MVTSVNPKPYEQHAFWSEPVTVDLESFHWQLETGKCAARIPDLSCNLIGTTPDRSFQIDTSQVLDLRWKQKNNDDELIFHCDLRRLRRFILPAKCLVPSYAFRFLVDLIFLAGTSKWLR